MWPGALWGMWALLPSAISEILDGKFQNFRKKLKKSLKRMVRNARSRAQRLDARNRAARRAQELPQGMAIQDEAARREEARERHNRLRR